MRKIIAAALLAAAICLLFAGCWDYRSLDELTVVAGMAVDKCESDPGLYSVTFELVDLEATGNQNELKSTLLESEGPTLFQAVHNASSRLHNEMYFGNMDILVLSESVAVEKGLDGIVNALLRDYSMRDTLCVLISREDTAREIITPQEGKEGIASYNISQGISKKNSSLNSTKAYDLISIYGKLSADAGNIALPAFSFAEDSEEKQLITDGAAIFREGSLIGFMDEKEMPYFLFITERLNGGSYTFYPDEGGYATLALKTSSSGISFDHDDDGLIIYVKIKAVTGVIDLTPDHKSYSGGDISRLEREAEGALNAGIQEMIRVSRERALGDIFGFGLVLSQKEPRYWEWVKDDWDSVFLSARVVVESGVEIKDTGFINMY